MINRLIPDLESGELMKLRKGDVLRIRGVREVFREVVWTTSSVEEDGFEKWDTPNRTLLPPSISPSVPEDPVGTQTWWSRQRMEERHTGTRLLDWRDSNKRRMILPVISHSTLTRPLNYRYFLGCHMVKCQPRIMHPQRDAGFT